MGRISISSHQIPSLGAELEVSAEFLLGVDFQARTKNCMHRTMSFG